MTWLSVVPALLLMGCRTAVPSTPVVTPQEVPASAGGFGLAVFDADSASTQIKLSSGGTMPVRMLDEPSLRLQRVRATQVVVAGIWTVAFDIPGDEMRRMDALVDQFDEVYLVWQNSLVRTWSPGSIAPLAKRYGQECYIPGAGLRDEESANAAAQQISLLHSGVGVEQVK